MHKEGEWCILLGKLWIARHEMIKLETNLCYFKFLGKRYCCPMLALLWLLSHNKYYGYAHLACRDCVWYVNTAAPTHSDHKLPHLVCFLDMQTIQFGLHFDALQPLPNGDTYYSVTLMNTLLDNHWNSLPNQFVGLSQCQCKVGAVPSSIFGNQCSSRVN